MQDCVVGEAARAEGDRSSVCVVEVFHEQIYVGLLGAIPRRPGRLNVVLDALERKALRLLYDVNDGHPIGSTVVTCISQHRLPEPAFLIRVGALEHDAEQASYRCGHHRSLCAAPHNCNGRPATDMVGV